MTVVFLFPGQGVQRQNMGVELFARFPALTEAASATLGYDLRELCADEERLAQTRYTQPATYVVSALALRAAREDGLSPDVALGHSLGEYNALEAAGAFGFLEGLELVRLRADITSQAAVGAMTAVQGLAEETVCEALGDPRVRGVEAVNFNSPTQTVLAGPESALASAEQLMRDLGAADVRRLAITGAFHSSHMREAAADFGARLERFSFEEPAIPVVSNLTARPHSAADIAGSLVRHVHSPVRWHQSVTWVVENFQDVSFHQPGVSQVLVRMLRQIPAAANLLSAAAGGAR